MRKLIVSAAVISLFVAALAGCGTRTENINQDVQVNTEAPTTEASLQTEATEAPVAPSTEAPEATTEISTEAPQTDEAPGTGSYEVDGINVLYYNSVRNDVTGNWRLAVVSTGADLNDYALDFYNYFVRDDSEVFGIVNLGLKTSTLITPVMDDWYDIQITEYQSGEEHDANMLYGGMALDNYWLNAKTGEVDRDLN